MVRMIATFVLVLLLALGAAWLADQPGGLVLQGAGYEVALSPLAAGIALVLFAVIVILIWQSYHWVVGMPGMVGTFARERGRRRGMEALSRGLIAAGAGDPAAAAREAAIAEKQLGQVPLTLLLNAQTAQLAGDEAAARRSFEAMMDQSETEPLGLRGLFMQARKSGDAATARRLAERAMMIVPQSPWASLALFELQCAEQDWAGASRTLETRRRHKLVTRKDADRLAGVIATAQAQERDDAGEADAALEHAQAALKLAPDLVPAAVLAGRLLAGRGDRGRASRTVERTWKLLPHPDLADLYAHIRPGDAPRDRLKRVKDLAARNIESPEGSIAVARVALEARLFDEARQALQPLLDEAPSQRVCALMAEIENAENGDRGRVREWLARAVNAPRDPAWVADGFVSETWQPVSPVSGEIDAFVWRVPMDGALPAVDHLLELAEPRAEAPEADAPKALIIEPVETPPTTEPEAENAAPTDATAETSASAAPEPAAKPEVVAGNSAKAPEPPVAATAHTEGPMVATDVAAAPSQEAEADPPDPTRHQPDDPGIVDEDDPEPVGGTSAPERPVG